MAKVHVHIPDRLARLLSKPKRVKIAVGGRGSGKSIGVGDIMLGFADQGKRICAAREFQNSIDDSVHESLKDEILRLGADGYSASATDIKSSSGGRIFYRGLARNIKSLKSLAGTDFLWIEEGESVSEDSLKVLTPSIRSKAGHEGEVPEIWITMNRGSSSDAIAKKYLSRADADLRKHGYYEDDLMIAVELNWRDNPWFPSELSQERLDDYANLSRAEYRHIWEGEYNDEIENAIIPAEWFDAAIDAHLKLSKKGFKPRGQRIVTHDPADSGDAKAICDRHGSVVHAILERTEGDVNDCLDWSTDYAIEVGADLYIWDGDGIGLPLKRDIEKAFNGKRIDYQMFRGSEGVDFPSKAYQKGDVGKQKTNRNAFKNKRAQYYWMLRDRFWNTYRAVEKGEYIDPDDIISLSSDIEDLAGLRAEVCRIPRKHQGNGLIQIMDKKTMMVKYKIPSPNRADCLMMSMRTVIDKSRATINQSPDNYDTGYSDHSTYGGGSWMT